MSHADTSIVNFFYELGSMRLITRAHRQLLMVHDTADNIASHSYRVAMIAWFLAQEEDADPYKTIMMALLHDVPEVRSGDHNYIHKRYVKVHEDEIVDEQLGTLPYPQLKELAEEYTERTTAEAIIAKDADLLDQILLLKEYEWQGNKEASVWLHGKGNDKSNVQLRNIQTETGKRLGELMIEGNPADWWNVIWTNKNR